MGEMIKQELVAGNGGLPSVSSINSHFDSGRDGEMKKSDVREREWSGRTEHGRGEKRKSMNRQLLQRAVESLG